MSTGTIIVMNSLVARGAVGGRAAVFALERMGFEVVFLPTVLLSWHPGHGRATRVVTEELPRLVSDVAGAGWLSGVTGVLTGYFGDVAQVGEAARVIDAVRAANPEALTLCDPVVGDEGRLYQPEPLAAAIRDRLVPLADIVTPNRFELGWLAGRGVGNTAEIVEAATSLGRPEIVVTSATETAGRIETMLLADGEAVMASHRREPRNRVNGTGDLLAALYLGHRLKGQTPRRVLRTSLAAVEALVRAAVLDGADELPLAAHQNMLSASSHGVAVRAYSVGRRKTPKRKPR